MQENSTPVKIPVVFSANRKIFSGIVYSVLSIIRYTPSPISVYILTMDLTHLNERFKPITAAQAEKLNNLVKVFNPESEVILLDKTKEFIEEFGKSKNLKNGFTPYAITRLLLDKCPVPEKVIYMDVDTMCCSDLKQLYDVDISEYEVGMVLDAVGHYWVRPSYCNSGVLLLNFKMINETGLFVKARKLVNKRRMFMPDQSAINFRAQRKLIMPRRFNEQRTIKEDTVIKHFCNYFKWYGPIFFVKKAKQWERDKVHDTLGITYFDDVYEMYDKYDAIYHFEEEVK